MNKLVVGAVIFVGIHAFSMLAPHLRDRLKAQMGERPWKGLFAIISLIGLALMIWGWAGSRAGPEAADILYFPPDWTRHVTMLLVLIAFILIGASHGKGYIKLWVRQPMSLCFALWAFGHLLSNGKRADVILFGAILVVALLDIIISTARGKVPVHEPRIRSDIIAVIVGVILYFVFLLGFHPYVLNLPIV